MKRPWVAHDGREGVAMRGVWWVAAGLLLGLASASAADICPLFVIERHGATVEVVRDTLAEGEVRVFKRDVRSGTVDVVLPVGPGQSAGFLQASDADMIVMRYAGGRLSGQARRADGRTVDLAARALDDLRRQDIRVSVSVGDGARTAFLISGYRTVAADTAGPTQNLFAGRLPEAMLNAGVVVLTDTYAHDPEVRACGRVPLERQGYLFARGRRDDRAEGWFIVDLAASVSMVARSFLPAGATIRPLSMSEHSAQGQRSLPYSPTGATGPIATVLGTGALPAIVFGDLRLSNVEMTVLERMPEGFGRPVAGILGMDVLRGCGRLVLDLPPDSSRAALALLASPAAGIAGAPAAETPFSWIASHVVVRGTLEGRPVHWILDSGSPRTVVDSVGAPALAAAEHSGPGTLRGLEGPAMQVTRVRASSLTVGALEHRNVGCDVAPLAVFDGLRQPGYALGVLGLAEIARCRSIEVDFEHRLVRWLR